MYDTINSAKAEGKFVLRGVFRHTKKNGDTISVEIRSNDISYKGRAAKVVLVNDITERTNYISAIEQQNDKLQDIAWMQSHVVRAPLATMMGFVNLLKEGNNTEEEHSLIMENIAGSADELDKIIREISAKSGEVKPLA